MYKRIEDNILRHPLYPFAPDKQTKNCSRKLKPVLLLRATIVTTSGSGVAAGDQRKPREDLSKLLGEINSQIDSGINPMTEIGARASLWLPASPKKQRNPRLSNFVRKVNVICTHNDRYQLEHWHSVIFYQFLNPLLFNLPGKVVCVCSINKNTAPNFSAKFRPYLASPIKRNRKEKGKKPKETEEAG